jgi:hypothetical protein
MDGDQARKTIGRAQVAESMGLKCTSQVEERRGRKNCGRHDMGRRRGGKGQMAEVMR